MIPGMPSIGDMVSTVIGKFAEMLWGIFGPILASVFTWIDKSTEPTIIYTPDGPLGKVFPITLWIGGFLVVGLGLIALRLLDVHTSAAAAWAADWESVMSTLLRAATCAELVPGA